MPKWHEYDEEQLSTEIQRTFPPGYHNLPWENDPLKPHEKALGLRLFRGSDSKIYAEDLDRGIIGSQTEPHRSIASAIADLRAKMAA